MQNVENNIVAKLRQEISQIPSSQLFKIFQKYNSLFYKPKIKGFIIEYQSQLLNQVKQDIQKLQNKFSAGFQKTFVAKICLQRDFHPVSSYAIWVNLIRNKLSQYMVRVQNILGSDWKRTIEGKQVEQQHDQFENLLNFPQLIESWKNKIIELNSNMRFNELIFSIVQKKKLEITVNFDDRILTLFKEKRNLNYAKIQVNAFIYFVAEEFQKIYPFAMSLSDSIFSFNQISYKLNQKMAKYVATQRKLVLDALKEGISIRWNDQMLLAPYT